MSERTHSCNYGPREAFEVFEHLEYLMLQRPRWRLGPRVLPPPESPFYALLHAVLADLHALGFARPAEDGGWLLLKRKRWRPLLKCCRECVNCKHKRSCPLSKLFQSKGWRLPDEQLINSFYEGEGEKEDEPAPPSRKTKFWQAAFNDLLLVLTRKRSHSLTLSPRLLYNHVGDVNRSHRVGKVLKYLASLGLAKRINRSKRRKRYRLTPQPIWHRFIQICGSKSSQERYKCDGCPLAPQCPYVIVTRRAMLE